MGHRHDWWEVIRSRTLPWLHRWLAVVGAYAEGEVAHSSYALTAGRGVESLERDLHTLGFVRNPIASIKRRGEHYEAGSWVRRQSLLADRQLHIELFPVENPGGTDVYAHVELSWITHPLSHYRKEGIDVIAGVREVRHVFREAGIPMRVRSDAPADARDAR